MGCPLLFACCLLFLLFILRGGNTSDSHEDRFEDPEFQLYVFYQSQKSACVRLATVLLHVGLISVRPVGPCQLMPFSMLVPILGPKPNVARWSRCFPGGYLAAWEPTISNALVDCESEMSHLRGPDWALGLKALYSSSKTMNPDSIFARFNNLLIC